MKTPVNLPAARRGISTKQEALFHNATNNLQIKEVKMHKNDGHGLN